MILCELNYYLSTKNSVKFLLLNTYYNKKINIDNKISIRQKILYNNIIKNKSIVNININIKDKIKNINHLCNLNAGNLSSFLRKI